MFNNAALPRRAVAWVLLSAGMALAAGVSMAAPAQTASAPTAIKATELEPTPDPSLSFNDMANAMGLFAKYGLTYEAGPKLGGGGPTRVQAVVTGNTEVATSDIISVMGGIYSGAKIKILMVMTPYGDEEVLGRNKYKTLKDAVGQTWGVASLAGAQRFNAQMTVEGMGFKPDAFQWIGDLGRRCCSPPGARYRAAHSSRVCRISASCSPKLGAIPSKSTFWSNTPPNILHRCRGSWWWRATTGLRATEPSRRAMSR